MVTERADAPEPGADSEPQDQGGMVDITPDGQTAPSFDAVDDAPVAQDAGTETTVQGITPDAPPSEPTPTAGQPQPQQVDQQSFTELRDQVRAQQEQLQYYNQLEQRNQLQQQTVQWQQEFERQGYLPEQAQQMSQERATRSQESQQMQRQADEYRQFREGQRAAALHFAKEHKLGFDDLSVLEKYNTPEEMEIEAKRIAETRDLKAELARLKQDQVPTQSFDNNQPSPSATGSEDDLLDKYIAGDRSPSVVAAAARLLG